MAPAIDHLDTNNPGSTRSLLIRVISSAIMIPIVLAAIYIGGGVFSAMVSFLYVVLVYEWTRMVERKTFSASFYLLSSVGIVAFIAAVNGAFGAAFLLASVAGLAAFYAANRAGGVGLWTGFGAFYLTMPIIALLWLRTEVPDGRNLTFLLFFVVWAADIGAFVTGKAIGGPKISHALSPSKTWSGIAGGVVGGMIVGAAAGQFLFEGELAMFGALGGGMLGAASVIGDLAESAFKRNFGVKDISGFIPGHGGALDRLDGMIFATSAMTGAIFLYMLF